MNSYRSVVDANQHSLQVHPLKREHVLLLSYIGITQLLYDRHEGKLYTYSNHARSLRISL